MGDLRARLLIYDNSGYRDYSTDEFETLPSVGEVYHHFLTEWAECNGDRKFTQKAFLITMVVRVNHDDRTTGHSSHKNYKVYMREIKLPITFGNDGNPKYSFVIEHTPTAASVTTLPRS